MPKNLNQNENNAGMLGMGITLATVAAGAYFFLGPQGKKHQKKMRGWMVRMKGEVLEKLEDIKDVSEPIYDEIVDNVAKANQVAGKIPRDDIQDLADDLKRQWKTIKRALSGDKKKAVRVVSKTKSAAKGTKRSGGR